MSSKLKCASCNIVICELLAFIQNKQDVMDEESLVALCLSSFSSEDIDEAKNLLFTAISRRKISRKKASKSCKDLYDVITVFKETNPDDLPVYVAKELQKLPPLTFDHIDASRLLKDLIVLKSDLQAIKDNYVTHQQLQDVKAELLNLRHASLINEPDYFINKKRGGGCENSYCLDSGPIGLPHITQSQQLSEPVTLNDCSPSHSGVLPQPSPSRSSSITAPAPVGANNNIEPPGIISKVQFSTSDAVSRTFVDIVASEGQCNSKENMPTDDWIQVQRKRLRNRFVSNHGKADIDPSEKFKAANIKIPLFINNVDKSTTEKDIVDYISTKTQVHVDLRKLNSKESKQCNAFIVYVPKDKMNLFINDSLWPEGVTFRRFINFKKYSPHIKDGTDKKKSS